MITNLFRQRFAVNRPHKLLTSCKQLSLTLSIFANLAQEVAPAWAVFLFLPVVIHYTRVGECLLIPPGLSHCTPSSVSRRLGRRGFYCCFFNR